VGRKGQSAPGGRRRPAHGVGADPEVELEGQAPDTLPPPRRVGKTPTIVLKAALILEEELAHGLGAAKRIEQRFIDVEHLRMQPPDALLSKFRRDAHDAVDILVDVIASTATNVTGRAANIVNVTARRMSSVGSRRPQGESSLEMQLPSVMVPGVVAAGEVAEVAVTLENESSYSTAEFTLHSSELVTGEGSRIPAESVTFSPATLSVGPHASGRVTARVHVPEGTPEGLYEGLVRASQLQSLRAMLRVHVR
jgi:hypothetical protein